MRLNSCSNGRCSARPLEVVQSPETGSLNPCSNGRCSASLVVGAELCNSEEVLILVLMEDALRGRYYMFYEYDGIEVLILVLMEDALRGGRPV